MSENHTIIGTLLIRNNQYVLSSIQPNKEKKISVVNVNIIASVVNK